MSQEQLEKPTTIPHVPAPYDYSYQMNGQQKPQLPAQVNRKSLSMSIVVMSIPVLYVFLLHLSPNTLLKDTKFWFLVSNTIIIVIAADSGVFSASSKGGDGSSTDIYDEFVKRTREMRQQQQEEGMSPIGVSYTYTFRETESVPEPVVRSAEDKEKPYSSNDNRTVIKMTAAADRNEREVTASATHEKPSPNDLPPVVRARRPRHKQPVQGTDVEDGASKRYRRCKTSEVPVALRNRIHGKEVAVSRSATFSNDIKAQKEVKDAAVEVSNDEYSAMSNEELNRRVEEFIRRVNRQIRLQ